MGTQSAEGHHWRRELKFYIALKGVIAEDLSSVGCRLRGIKGNTKLIKPIKESDM